MEGVPHVGFTLICGGDKLKSALWRISANVKLVIRKKDNEEFVERNYREYEFTFASKTLADMVPWEDIECTFQRSKNDNKPLILTIELHIDIVKIYGFRYVPKRYRLDKR
ncbi:hypothetical protein COOONC_12093 [Cooperia oncophora]